MRERLAQDAYVRYGVFDPAKTKVYPFASALPATSPPLPFSALDADAEAQALALEAARQISEEQKRQNYVGLAALRLPPSPAPSLGLSKSEAAEAHKNKATTLDQLRKSPALQQSAAANSQQAGVTLQGLRAMHTSAAPRRLH